MISLSRMAAALVAALACSGHAVHAAAEPPTVSGVSTFGALFQGLLGLAVVLAALAGFFWFLRRFSPGQTGAQGVVKVVGGVMLGTRERLVVVEVGDTWLLLGVGGGQVTHVHHMPRPAGYVPPVAGRLPGGLPGFADKLKDYLPKRPG
jgi:flagellar protein FliO/FliZ